MSRRDDLDVFEQRGLSGVGSGTDEPAMAALSAGDRGRKGPGNPPHLGVQSQLTEAHPSPKRLFCHPPLRGKYAQRDRKVEVGAFFTQGSGG
jgi:hypothetical protein